MIDDIADPKTPTKGAKERMLEVLRAKRAAQRNNKLKLFKPYPKQIEVIAATKDHTEVAARWGNQLGKTACFSCIASVFATGMYPPDWQGRRFDRPTRGWIVGESTTAVRDVAQTYITGTEGAEPGFIPPDRVSKVVLGHGAGGGIDRLFVRHVSAGGRYRRSGSVLRYGTREIAGRDARLDLVRRRTTNADLSGVAGTPDRDGRHCPIVLHAVVGFGRIIPRFNERNPEALRNRVLIPGRMDEFPQFQDPEKRRGCSRPSRSTSAARIDGLPLLGSGAVFEDVQLEEILAPLRLATAGGQRTIIHNTLGPMDTSGLHWLWAIDFGIDHPFAAVLLARDADTDTVYIVAEVKIKGATPPTHASRMNAIMPDVRVAWPHDGNDRDKGSGEHLADIYRKEGLLMLPTHAQFAHGGYSTEAGIMLMLTRFKAGTLKVAAGCYEWQDEFSTYHRKEGLIVKEYDDLLSATRIGIMQMRSAKPVGSERRAFGQGGYSTIPTIRDYNSLIRTRGDDYGSTRTNARGNATPCRG